MTDERVKARRFLYASVLIFFIAYSGKYLGTDPEYNQFSIFMFWAYTLFCDYLTHRLCGASLLVSRTQELFPLAFVSMAVMGVFELFNLRLATWHYINCPPELSTRWSALALCWAAFLPSLFITTELLAAMGLFKTASSKRFSVPPWLLTAFTAAGLVMAGVAQAVPELFWPLGWAALFFIIEPLNFRFGLPSLLRELSWGRPGKILRLAVAGLSCGFIWNALNSFSGMHWAYAGLTKAGPDIFGLPLIVYPAFAFVAVEAYSINSLCSIFRGGKTWEAGAWGMREKSTALRFKYLAVAAGLTVLYFALHNLDNDLRWL